MRIKKRDVKEALNSDAVSNELKDVVSVVQGELDSTPEEAKKFVKSMYVSEDEDARASRSIEYGERDPELGNPDDYDDVEGVSRVSKTDNTKYDDLPFESTVREGKVSRKVLKRIKVKDLRK